VRRVDNQRRESWQNILLEEFCRLDPLPSAEIFPAQESDAMLLKSRQERCKACALLFDHIDNYGAEGCQKFSVCPSVLDPEDRDPLHEELIQVGREDGEKFKALK
jgi:hypothetical protein